MTDAKRSAPADGDTSRDALRAQCASLRRIPPARGGEMSERQWQDVLSILAAARGQPDEAYLAHWSRELHIADLLDRARREVEDQ